MDFVITVDVFRPLTKNYEVVHLHPSENVSDIQAVWNEMQSSAADHPLWNNLTSINRTNTSDETVGLPQYEAAIVFGTNEIILTNLKHYQEYNIEVCIRAVRRTRVTRILDSKLEWSNFLLLEY